MQKLRHINKEKNFLEWPRKRRNPEDQLAAQPDGPPLSRLCGPVCGFGSRSKEIPPRSHISPRWAIFEGRLGRQDFSGPCGSARQVRPKSHSQISRI